MVVVRITMGLGNQMFQYAAGLSLSKEKGTILKVDTSSYQGYKLRKYELDTFFGITTPEASREEIQALWYNHPLIKTWNKILPGKKIRVLGLPYEERIIQRNLLAFFDFFYPPHKRTTYTEPHYYHDKNFFNANKKLYLHGYWMSWKYFHKHEQAVRKAYAIKRELVQHLDDLTNELQSTNSVSVHIRRTDYTDPLMQRLKGVIPFSYYKKAIEKIQQQNENISLYFFSDDIDWVKQNLQFSNVPVKYIDKSVTSAAIEDFYLMTQCRYNIIANSTFSWWAAYLNNNEHKLVIAPKKWYSDDAPYDYKDVYPETWITMD